MQDEVGKLKHWILGVILKNSMNRCDVLDKDIFVASPPTLRDSRIHHITSEIGCVN